MIDIILPLAPTVNKTGAGRKVWKLTSWKTHAGWLIKCAKLNKVVGEYSFTMNLPSDDHADIDARIKATLDLFVQVGATDDDRHCKRLLVVYGGQPTGTCRVVIEEMS